MTRLVLHIGHPKTGTTTLQHTMTANRSRLIEDGILYPEPNATHKHDVLVPRLVPQDRVSKGKHGGLTRRLKKNREEIVALSERAWSELAATVAERRPGVVVISAENFWNLRDDAPDRLRRQLDGIASDVRVAAYLRSPAALYLSRLNQKIRMMRKLPIVSPSYYTSAIDSYAAGGFSDISLRVFDVVSLAEGDIVQDFCANYLPELSAPLQSQAGARTNESVSAEALTLLREVYISAGFDDYATRPKPLIRSRVMRVVREIERYVGGATKPRLHPEVAAAVVARSMDLLRLRDEIGVTFPDVDYSLVGTTPALDLDAVDNVPSLCLVDEARLDEMRAGAARPLAEALTASEFPRRSKWRRIRKSFPAG